MATVPAKPGNLIDSAVINNTVGAADVVLALSQLTITNLGTKPYWGDLTPSGFVHTAFAAGTAQITTLDTTAATLTAGVVNTTSIKRLDDNTVYTVGVVIATGETVVTLKAKIVAAISAQIPNTIVTSVSTGANTLTITEVGNIGGFIATNSDSGITVVTGTPHVNSSGTYAEVLQYDQNTLAGGQFDRYDLVGRKVIPENSGQANVLQKGVYVVWVEKNDAQFGAFNTAITAYFDGSSIVSAATTQPYLEKV